MKNYYERHEIETSLRHVFVERGIAIRDVCEHLGVHPRCFFNFKGYSLDGARGRGIRKSKVTLRRVAEVVAKLSGRLCSVEELVVPWRPDFENEGQ